MYFIVEIIGSVSVLFRVSVLYKDKSLIPISVYSRNYCMLFRVHYPDIDSDNMKGMNSLQIQIWVGLSLDSYKK